jgi:hypothetical protein
MHTTVVPLLLALEQQWSFTPGDWPLHELVLTAVRALLGVTHVAFSNARMLVPAELQVAAVQAVMRMLQQLYNCAALPAAASAGSSAGSSIRSSSRSFSLLKSYVCVQQTALTVIDKLQDFRHEQQLAATVEEQVKQLLLDPAVQGMLLQHLVACIAVLHNLYEAQQQQQQPQQQRRQRAGPLQRVLAIPAFHQDLLLPGGQAFLKAAAAVLASEFADEDDSIHNCWVNGIVAANLLHVSLTASSGSDSQQQGGVNLMLSAAAMRLVLELQLLAAAAAEQQLQGQAQQQRRRRVALTMLKISNSLLSLQIQVALQRTGGTGGSCLPPEVLQQAGLQLLQALAAPVQHSELLDGLALMRGTQSFSVTSPLQLYALRAAAEGVPALDINATCK